jgi:hypothetical protein
MVSMGDSASFLKGLVWQSQKNRTQEYFRLSQTADGYLLNGTVIVSAALPVLVNYEVECSTNWQTRNACVGREMGGKTERLKLEVDQNLCWFTGKSAIPGFKGVSDVDFDFSPSTNTIPIRRLNLGVGESKEVETVWIRLDGLKLETLKQRYTRTGSKRYRYKSLSFGFEAEIEVDELGIIVKYGDLWRRIA